MKLLNRWIVGLCLVNGLMLTIMAQETSSPPDAPSRAKITALGQTKLRPRQPFSFQLRFDVAPEYYKGGTIKCFFQKTGSPVTSYAWSAGQLTAASKETDLHDGQAIYTLELPIDFAMAPGTWKLTKVTYGNSQQVEIVPSDDVTFEILEVPPVKIIRIEPPPKVVAGTPFPVKVSVDKPAEILEEGCTPFLAGFVRDSSNPPHTANLSEIELVENQHSYELTGNLISDVPVGKWEGELSVKSERKMVMMHRMCGYAPRIDGHTHFTIVVERSPELVTPTSVAVIVNPSQAQLLLGEADKLKAKAQHLRDQMVPNNPKANAEILQSGIRDALNDVSTTEASFKIDANESRPSKPVNEFFDDIRLGYNLALKELATVIASDRPSGPRLQQVGLRLDGVPAHLDRVSELAIKSIARNESGYRFAAKAGQVVFSLEVSTRPQGATILYALRGDPFKTLDRESNATIHNLTFGDWLIRLKRPGCKELNTDFDGMDDPIQYLDKTLDCKPGVR